MQTKAHRMRRVFAADGRTLIVAMDHAGYMGPVPGLSDPIPTVRAVVAGGADAVMTTLGTARRIVGALDGRGLVLSVDLHAPDPLAVVENAIALGADSLKTLAYWGTDDLVGWRNLGRYGVLCDRWGLPFQAEVIPFGFGATDKHRDLERRISLVNNVQVLGHNWRAARLARHYRTKWVFYDGHMFQAPEFMNLRALEANPNLVLVFHKGSTYVFRVRPRLISCFRCPIRRRDGQPAG